MTSNKHLYMKKNGGLPDTTLKKGKSSLSEAWTTILQDSLGFASFTWHCSATTFAEEAREDLHFKTSSLTHS